MFGRKQVDGIRLSIKSPNSAYPLLTIRLSPSIVRQLGLEPGVRVDMETSGDRVRIFRCPSPKGWQLMAHGPVKEWHDGRSLIIRIPYDEGDPFTLAAGPEIVRPEKVAVLSDGIAFSRHHLEAE